MNETEIRDRLADVAADAPTAFTAPSQLLRRARRRVRLTVASSVAVVLVLVGAGIAGVHALGRVDAKPAVQPSVEPSVEPTDDAFAVIHGWIVYRSGNEIVAVDPANPNNTLVLRPGGMADPIAWSADGTKLLLRGGMDQPGAFSGTENLIVLSSNGSMTRVPGAEHATWGSFSPDGSQIVYGISGSHPGPYVIDANGGAPRALVASCDGLCGQPFSESAAWSPDGSRIAWADFTYEDTYVLSLVNPDGTGLQTEVTRLPVSYESPTGAVWSLTWSPDGSRLAYSDWDFFHDRQAGQVFVINADGSGLQQITNDGANRWPTWSHDGSLIAFVHDGALYTMAPDGTEMREVTGVHPDGAIAWNPAPGHHLETGPIANGS